MQKQFIWNTDKQLNEEKIVDLNREMQTLYKEKRNSEENKVITEVTNNPKAFSKYANKYRKYTSKLGPLKAWSKYEDDPKTMTKILTDQYKSVFTTPKDIPVVSLKPAKNGNSLSEIAITDKDIKEAIDDMVIMSTPGRRRYHG